MRHQMPVFENLCPSWNSILHLGIRRTFQKGCPIFDLGEPINGIYFLKEGLVEIPLFTQKGPEKVLFYIGPNCIFGEVSCFVTGFSREAYARARSDCVVYFFSLEQLEGVIAHQYPHLLIELIKVTANKIWNNVIMLPDSLAGNDFLRVCKMLMNLTDYCEVSIAENQKRVVFQPKLTQGDLAKLMGIHRMTVTKAMARLKEMGIIDHFTKNSLEISDYPALCAMVKEDEICEELF
jgi:CRP-like cAMP-binding protein